MKSVSRNNSGLLLPSKPNLDGDKDSEKMPNNTFTFNQTSNQIMSSKDQPTDLLQAKKRRTLIPWTPSEDSMLFQNYAKIGSKWAELSKLMPQKSQNSLKNRFYCCIRKVQKKINTVQAERKLNNRKLLSFQTLLTCLEVGKSTEAFTDGRFKTINENTGTIGQIKNMIILQATQPENYINYDRVQALIGKILAIKHSLKFINVRRVKKNYKNSLQPEEDHERSIICESLFEKKQMEKVVSETVELGAQQNENMLWNQNSLMLIQEKEIVNTPSLLPCCDIFNELRKDSFEVLFFL